MLNLEERQQKAAAGPGCGARLEGFQELRARASGCHQKQQQQAFDFGA